MALGIIAGSIGNVAAVSANGARDASAIASDFLGGLRPASLGGVPFGLYEARTTAGRRNAVHEYPYRDEVYVEDVGMLPRRIDLTGFLVENSMVYGGGSLSSQRAKLLGIVEGFASNSLVHPTLGTIPNVNVLAFEMSERLDLGPAVLEFRMTLLRDGLHIYPSGLDVLDSDDAAGGLDAAALADFQSTVVGPVLAGAAVVQSAVSDAVRWYGHAVRMVHDVRRFWSALSNLPGDYGRYHGGGNAGFTQSNDADPNASVQTLTAEDVRAREAFEKAGAELVDAAGRVGSDTPGFAAAAQAMTAAVTATAADPVDAIRMMADLASFTSTARTSSSPVGVAIATIQAAESALFRRAAIAEVARTVTRYQPTSLDDARAMRIRVVALIGVELLTAGDTGDTESFRALRALRKAVTVDLDSRAGGLPVLKTFRVGQPMPSLALAHRLYADAAREPGLTKQINPIHPAFCPTQFAALAS